MAGAFQSSAFQNSAYQTDRAVAVVAPPIVAGGAGSISGRGSQGVRRQRAEYVDHFRRLERDRRKTEEIERLEALEREALAKAEAAAQALEDAEATDRANAQYEQSIARLSVLADQADEALQKITTLRVKAEQDAADDEDAIAVLLMN